MRVTVISIDFSPRKSPERAIGWVAFYSVSFDPGTYESNRMASLRRGRYASLPYVVHGKRRRRVRERFSSGSRATVFAWLTDSRERKGKREGVYDNPQSWTKVRTARRPSVLFVPMRVLINVVAALITVAASLISSVILDFPSGSTRLINCTEIPSNLSFVHLKRV